MLIIVASFNLSLISSLSICGALTYFQVIEVLTPSTFKLLTIIIFSVVLKYGVLVNRTIFIQGRIFTKFLMIIILLVYYQCVSALTGVDDTY